MEGTPMDLAQGNLPRPGGDYSSLFEGEQMTVDDPVDFRTLDTMAEEGLNPIDYVTPPTVEEPSEDAQPLYTETEEGKENFDNYAESLIKYINSYRDPDTKKWVFSDNIEPNQDARSAYRTSKIKLLRGLDVIEKSDYSLVEDTDDEDMDINIVATPYLTDNDFGAGVMKSLHEQINFEDSLLHNEIPIKPQDLEPVMETLEMGTEQEFFQKLEDLNYDTIFSDV